MNHYSSDTLQYDLLIFAIVAVLVAITLMPMAILFRASILSSIMMVLLYAAFTAIMWGLLSLLLEARK